MSSPRGVLIDYGGTLVEEVAFDTRAGNEEMRRRATHWPAHVTLDEVVRRAERVSAEVAARRDLFQIETPWPSLTRLIHEPFGIRFDEPMPDLELAFWNASATTREMPGARAALDALHEMGIPMGVVSNSSFGSHVIGGELAKHGLAEHLAFVIVSADYVVRKPNPMLFEVAAARLGLEPRDIWFIGDRLDTDVAGARAAGMTAVWFAPANAGPSADAHITIESWAELAETITASVER